MPVEMLINLLPVVVLGIFPVLMLLVTAFRRSHGFIFGMAVLGFVLAFGSLFFSGSGSSGDTDFLIMDDYARYYIGLLIFAALLVSFFSFKYYSRSKKRKEEYYILLVLATFGSSIMVMSMHFISLFLGLEVLSVSLYTLIAYSRSNLPGTEAGVKYLVLASASSAFLLLGMALVYFMAGTMTFAGMAEKPEAMTSAVGIAGLAMIAVGIGFKLALVPFHLWTADVYQGAPAPVTALIASVSKGGVFAVFLRFFSGIDYLSTDNLVTVVIVIAILSMLTGNLLALLQRNVKRILAYSSIGHLGYILIAFLSLDADGAQAATFYLTAYIITILGAFGMVSLLSDAEREAGDIEDYAGMFWRRPWLATIFTAVLLSLAGIPLTVGFMGKYYLLLVGVQSEMWLPVLVLVISSLLGLFYYLRIIVAMLKVTDRNGAQPSTGFMLTDHLALTIVLFAVICFGMYPAGLMELIRYMIVF